MRVVGHEPVGQPWHPPQLGEGKGLCFQENEMPWQGVSARERT